MSWISVKRRLPQVDKAVLTCDARRSGRGIPRMGRMEKNGLWYGFGICAFHSLPVTHWMPLPDFPRVPRKRA